MLAEFHRFDTQVTGSYRGLIVVVGLVIVLLAIVYTAVRNRRHIAESDVKICGGCATPHPVGAQFCRKCGKRLG